MSKLYYKNFPRPAKDGLMNRMDRTDSRNDQAFWFFVIFSSSGLGLLLWMANDELTKNTVLALLGVIFAIIVLRFPLIGFGILIVSAPIVELLPRVPVVSSILVPLGGFTLLAFFINRKRHAVDQWRLSSIEALALLYIFWVFFSHPNASFYGRDRSWVLTFAQLFILLWMARYFVRSEEDHQLIIVIATLGILGSAIVAIRQVSLGIELVDDRASGLSGGANTAARYFVYGIILLSYLQGRLYQQRVKRLLAFGGIVLLIGALFATGSRSGLLLLGISFFFLTQRFLVGRQRSIALWLTIGAGLVWVLIQASGTILDPAHIADAILSGSDTVGARYDFWTAGWAMWLDHPISGVGIGEFRTYLIQYWRSPRRIVAFTPHNTYIQVLSETGIVGFSIYAALLFAVILNFRSKIKTAAGNISNIHWTWLIILILLLVGSLTKTDMLDKFFWFLMGISINTNEKDPA